MANSARVTNCIVFLFALSFTFFALQSADVLMYLALARDFIVHGEFAPKDPYLYSLGNADLHIAHEYLSYLLFSGAWEVFGVAGLTGLKMLILTLLFVLVLRFPPRESQTEPLWLMLWMLAVAAASFRFIERSSIFSDLFCILLLTWLLEARHITRALVVRMAGLFLLWVQLHPGFPLGILMLAMWGVWRAFTEHGFQRKSLAWLLIPPVLLCVNPLGVEGALYPFRFALHEAHFLKLHNFEWFPSYHPAFRATPEILAFWLLLLASAVLLLRARAWRNLNGLFALFCAASAIQAVRFVPWASFALVILCKPALPVWRGRVSQILFNLLIVAMATIAVKNFTLGYSSSSGPRYPRFAFDKNFFPMETLDFLRANRLAGNLYNAHDFGSYLVWQGYTPIFHHGFVTDLGFYQNDVIGVFQSQERFLQLAHKYNWTKLLVDKHGSYPYFFKILSPLTNWKIVSEDDASYLIYYLPEGGS